MMPARERREDGVALVLVVWVIALIAILAVGFVHDTRTQATIARDQYDGARARALADSGIFLAILGILEPPPEAPWRLDGSARDLIYGDGKIRLRLQDEGGKIDLNRASGDVLANLFRTQGVEEDDAVGLAQAVTDWKRHRLAQWNQLGSARSGAPSTAGIGPFLALADLRGVPGITPEIYDRTSPFLTVFSRIDKINPVSAPRQVLVSLPGANSREIDAYVAARERFWPNPPLLPELTGIGGYLAYGTVTSVSITSEGIISPRARFVREATISLVATGGSRFRFLSWQQGPE